MPLQPAPLSAVERIEPAEAGSINRVQPASFLERWGTIFVAVGLIWMIGVATGLMVYFLMHLPQLPSTGGFSPIQVKDALDIHKQLYDQYRQSLTDIFDLLVTRTVLPIVTLLLGYLFGKTPNRVD